MPPGADPAMQPQRYDFPTLARGDSETLTLFFATQDVFSRDIVVAPLAGAVVTWSVKRPGQSDYLRSTALGGGLTLTGEEARIDWDISAADWVALPGGTYDYRVRVTYSDGRRQTYLYGILQILD